MPPDDKTPSVIQVERAVDCEIVGSGEDRLIRFRLVTSAGLSPVYECDPVKLGGLQSDLQLLFAKVSGQIVSRDVLGQRVDVLFNTDVGGAMSLSGENYSGQFVFLFRTSAGHSLATGIGPNLAQKFYDVLRLGLSGMEQTPIPSNKNLFTGMFIPGEQKNVGKPIEAFGQTYPEDLVTELGIFLIRANLLERSMIRLLQQAAGVNEKTASALFYSTVNVRARITMIQAAISVLSLDPQEVGLVEKALNMTSQVTQRRNRLVHGFWSFKNDKFEVDSFEPTKASGSKTEVVTAKSLIILTSDYYKAGVLIESAADVISRSSGGALRGDREGIDHNDNVEIEEAQIPPQKP